MTTSDTNARIHAHMAAGTLFSWCWAPYSGCDVVVVGVVDVSGKGRFERVETYGQTLAMALADLVSICDGLPGGHRAYRDEGRAVA